MSARSLFRHPLVFTCLLIVGAALWVPTNAVAQQRTEVVAPQTAAEIAPVKATLPPLPQRPNGLADFLPPHAVLQSADPYLTEEGSGALALLDEPERDQAAVFAEELAVIVPADTFSTTVAVAFEPDGATGAGRMRFDLHVNDPGDGSPIEQFTQAVRIVIDARGSGDPVNGEDREWFLAYEDPEVPGRYLDVPVRVHQADGLLSADVDHFSNWVAGDRPKAWGLSWNPPVVSEFSGAATFNYPIELPPGRNGLQPSVALSYSSRSLDGAVLGLAAGDVATGWSLGEIKVVRDQVRTELREFRPCNGNESWYYCKRWVAVFPDQYRLVLNGSGHRLIQVDPTNSTAAVVRYVAEGDPTLRVYRYYLDTAPNAEKLYWIVTTAAGVQYQMGFQVDAEEVQITGAPWRNEIIGHRGADGGPNNGFLPPNTATVAWHVDTVTDPRGNQITYHYNRGETTHRYGDPNAEYSTDELVIKAGQVRLSHIAYNYPLLRPAPGTPATQVYYLSRPAALTNPASTEKPATIVYFAHKEGIGNQFVPVAGFPWHVAARLYPITRIAVYHQPNLVMRTQSDNPQIVYPPAVPPMTEYRLTAGTVSYDNSACYGPGAWTTTRRLLSITRHANTDDNLNTDDVGYALPATQFGYIGLPHQHEPGGSCSLTYEYLNEMRNGYGGGVRFQYGSDHRVVTIPYLPYPGIPYPTPQFGKSYYVTAQAVTAQAPNSGIGSTPTITTTYTYGAPCYDQAGAHYGPQGGANCASPLPPGATTPDAGPLVGFSWTDVRVFDEQGVLQTRKRTNWHTGWLTDTEGQYQGTYWAQGRPNNELVYMWENGVEKLVQETAHFYDPIPASGGLLLREVSTRQRQYVPGDSAQFIETRTQYEFDPALQGGAQWGLPTAVREHGDVQTSSDDRTTLRRYASNVGAPWIVGLVAAERLYAGSSVTSAQWTTASFNLETRYGYDNLAWDQGPGNFGALTETTTGKPGSGLSSSGYVTTQRLGYNDFGNVTTMRDTRAAMHGDDNGVFTTVAWDNANLYPATVTNNQGQLITFHIYGFNGVGAEFNRPWGQLKEVVEQIDKVVPTRVKRAIFEYDPFGRLFAVYDSEAARLTLGQPWDGDPVTRYYYFDNLWNSSAMWLNPAADQPFVMATVTRPGSVTHTEGSSQVPTLNSQQMFDGFGRVIQTREVWTEAAGLNTHRRNEIYTTTRYGIHGVVCQTAPYHLPFYSDRGLVWPAAAYDSTACATRPHTATGYDPLGRVTVVTGPDGRQTRQIYALMTRDQIDNAMGGVALTTVRDYQSDSTQAVMPNQRYAVMSVVDPAQRASTQVAIGSGQVVYRLDTTGTAAPYAVYGVTTYGYDWAGQLVRVFDALGNRTTMGYDALGRKVSMSDPDMGNWNYAYDVAGSMTRQTDAKGNSLCFAYDAQGRPLTKWSRSGTTACGAAPATGAAGWLASWTYDGGVYALGQVSEVLWQGANSSIPDRDTFGYNAQGLVMTQTRRIDNVTWQQLVTAYDTLDRPTALTYPNGATVQIGYDREGENSLTVKLAAQSTGTLLINSVRYNPRGQLHELVRGTTGTPSTLYTYHDQTANFALQQIQTGAEASARFWQGNITYDPVGNITGFQRAIGSGSGITETLSFGYDHLNRLTSAVNSGVATATYNVSYGYDVLGNLTGFEGKTQQYATTSWSGHCTPPVMGMPHAVRSSGSDQFCYDANGNLMRRIVNTNTVDTNYTWDAENRLTEVNEVTRGKTTRYYYDPQGIRTLIVNPDGTKLYQPFPTYEEQRTAAGAVTAQRATYLLAGQAVVVQENDTFRYVLNDHLGSASGLLTEGGALVSGTVARYRPFGRTLTQPTNPALHIGFTGHDRTTADTGLNLIYMNARYYMPGAGRFLSPDTLIPDPAESQSFNRYAYVTNNPLRFTDPTGHCKGSYDAETGKATEDQSCWDQYNDFAKRLRGKLYNPFDIIGSGADYQFRDDYEIIWMLHDTHRWSWSSLLSHRFSRGPHLTPVRVCARDLPCDTGYEDVMYGGLSIKMDGEYLIHLWMDGNSLYATEAASADFRGAVDQAAKASAEWRLQYLFGWGAVATTVGCTAFTGGILLHACGAGGLLLFARAQQGMATAQKGYDLAVNSARKSFYALKQRTGARDVIQRRIGY